VLYRHPSVLVAAVVATPDDKWGEVPCAFIELADGDKTSKQQLLNWCREQLASYKVPKRIEFIEIPRTSTGKIQKYVLRELLQKESIKIQKVDEVNH
jgi:fatty-acyl-CoA synthase